jgi:flagellar biosynthesis GTPase FlhF
LKIKKLKVKIESLLTIPDLTLPVKQASKKGILLVVSGMPLHECTLCNEPYSAAEDYCPRVLPCQHVFCHYCLVQIHNKREKSLKCPLCGVIHKKLASVGTLDISSMNDDISEISNEEFNSEEESFDEIKDKNTHEHHENDKEEDEEDEEDSNVEDEEEEDEEEVEGNNSEEEIDEEEEGEEDEEQVVEDEGEVEDVEEEEEEEEEEEPQEYCESCDTTNHWATHQCLDCGEKMCHKASKTHSKTKFTKNHEVVTWQIAKNYQNSNPLAYPNHLQYCPTHKNQPLIYEDIDCHLFICEDCSCSNHSGKSF